MDVTTTIRTEVQLRLSDEEAQWLRSVMQNPIGEFPESGLDTRMRETFFRALPPPSDPSLF